MFATPWRLDRGPLWNLVLTSLTFSMPLLVRLTKSQPVETCTAGSTFIWSMQAALSAKLRSPHIASSIRLVPVRPFIIRAAYTRLMRPASPQKRHPMLHPSCAETVWNHHSHALDVQRGLYLQEILTSAAMGLDESH